MQKINIFTTIIHQKLVPKAKHIYRQPLTIKSQYQKLNIYRSSTIRQKYQKTSYICKFIHHTIFLITIHCSSTIHQKSVPKGIIYQVHDSHRSCMVALSNIERWRCLSTMSDIDITSLMKLLMWKSKPFLCSYK
jgi:hypothetical protein